VKRRSVTSERLLAAALVPVALVACHRGSSSPRPEPAQRVVEPASSAPAPGAAASASGGTALPSSLVTPERDFDFAVYLPAPVAPAQVRAAVDAVKQSFPGLPVRTKPQPADPPYALVLTPPLKDFAPPDETHLGYFGHGLDAAQKTAAAASKGVLVLSWSLDADPARARLREGQTLVHQLAQKLGGFVWDETTRELYTVDAWKKERLDGWEGDLPDTRRHVVIHYYEADGGRHRGITLGMEKFGLPDLVVEDAPLDESTSLMKALDAVAQVLVEGATPGPGGELRLDMRTIRHAGFHDWLIGSAGKDATFRGRIQLRPATAEDGDPHNRLVELRFPSYPGATDVERQASAFVSMLGAEPDEMAAAPADDVELAAVTARVQKRLPAVAAAFRAGLPLGERIVVKAPFETEDGQVEWMWVGVTSWRGDVVRGHLENEPVYVKSLRLGAVVQVKQASIADYRWTNADDTLKEGGESAQILKRREGIP
jgi:uncharacterized protein YegJ (DUF2314 family)